MQRPDDLTPVFFAEYQLGEGASVRCVQGRFLPTNYGRDTNHEAIQTAKRRAECRFRQHRSAQISHAAYLMELAAVAFRGGKWDANIDPVTIQDADAVLAAMDADVAFRRAKDERRRDLVASLTAGRVAA